MLDDKINSTNERLPPYFNEVGWAKLQKLRKMCSDIDEVTSSDEYIAFKKLWNAVVDDKKNDFFHFSEKGRDLHFIKGWYKAMKWIDDLIEVLKVELNYTEKAAAESRPFDDGE